MKNVYILFVFVSFASATNAQSNISPKNNFRQKKYLDSLRKLYKQPAIQINPQPALVYSMPIVSLQNEGRKIGMSGEDTIYAMKTDNMPMLKPNKKNTENQNALDGKIAIVPPVKKNP